MKDRFLSDRWSPYSVGIGIGILSCITLLLMHHSLGTSLFFVKVVGAFESWIWPTHFKDTTYFLPYFQGKAWFDWQMAFVVAIFFGSWVARLFSHKPSSISRPPVIWKTRFGQKRSTRYVGAFFGGVILLFGARLAGGCTSGHVISGGMQLAVAGWIFMGGLFGIGVPAAFIIYKKKKS